MKLTLLLIVINLLAFVYSLVEPSVVDAYGFSISSFLSGNYHTALTAMFLHAGLLHLGYNMIALFFLGWTIEKNVSLWQYVLVYFISGIFGNLSLFIPIFGYSADAIAIGASAAIAGLVGLGTFICPGKMVIFPAFPLPFVVAGAIYFLFTISNLFVESYVAHSAHLFGMLTGAVFGLAWGENRIKRLAIFVLLLILISILPFLIEQLTKSL